MYSSTPSSASALDVGGWLTPVYGRFTLGNDAVRIIREVGWAPGPVWMYAKNSPHNNSIFKRSSH